MDLVKDAFSILYFLASADGSVDERELQVIVDFINRQHGLINFDPHQTIADLARLTGEARIAAYDRALFNFRDYSGVQDRYTLMHFAADLVAADGAISANEKILFQDMAKVWGIDTQKLFQQAKSYAAPTAAPTAAAAAPASAPADGLSLRVNQGNLYAWELGNFLSLYALGAVHLHSDLTDSYFQKAKMAAGAMNLEINPLVGMSQDFTENYARLNEYFLKGEGVRLAAKMDEIYGAPVSDYFMLVVKCYLLLLFYRPSPTGRALAETTLTNALSRRQQTVIPEAYFGQLIGAVKRGIERELLEPVVSDFYESVSKFLFARTAPPAAPAPVAPNAEAPDVKTNRAYFFAWSLGSALSLYALAAASLNSSLAAEHFEKARTAALGLGLYPEPLTGLTGDARSNRILMLVYLLNREGIRLADEMDKQHGAAVSAYFYIVVNAYILLLQLAPETYLESIARFKARTALPDEFFNPITSAVRQTVEYENLKSTVAEFDRSVSVYLYNRIDGEKNAEQNIIRENYQNKNDFKPAAQTATAPNPSETLSAPLEILAAYSQGRAGNNEVLRALVSHRGWFAPLELFYTVGADTRDVEKVIVISQENQLQADSMCLFTDYESVMRALETNAPIGAYGGKMSGTELFAKIPAGINKIRVNSYSPTERTWSFMDATAVELARLWSEVITLEEQIENFQPGKPDLKALGDYRGFITVVNSETGGIFLVKEFDEEMRIAAPVFTAPDSADKFLANLPPDKAQALKQITINGHTLLNDLPNMKIEMPNNLPPAKFDGAVINAFGPGAFYILPFGDIRK